MPNPASTPTSALNYGGQDHPYPDSVPLCTPEQRTMRAVLERDPNDPNIAMATSIDPSTPFGDSYWDPSDSHVPRLREVMGQNPEFTGLCQIQISAEPQRFGLFWTLKGVNIQALLQGNDSQISSDSANQLRNNIEQYYPEHMKRCLPSAAHYESIDRQSEGLYDELRQLMAEREDPFVREDSINLANRLVAATGLQVMTDGQFEIFADAVNLALQVGVPEYVLYDIVDSLSAVYIDPEQFLYGFMAVVSLHIGRILDWQNRANGGISEDFDDFASSVEPSIMSGDIGFQVMTIGDSVSAYGAMAFYRPDQNVIVTPPLGMSRTVIASFFVPILHELYHAYQDKNMLSLTVGEEEFQAYRISTKAEILFGKMLSIDQDEGGGTLQDKIQSISTQIFDLKREYLECLGSFRSLNFLQEIQSEQSTWFGFFVNALNGELTGGSEVSSRIYFEKYYEYANFELMSQTISVGAQMRAVEAYTAGQLYDWPATYLDRLREYFTYLMTLIKDYTEPGTPERLEYVRACLTYYYSYASTATFVDPQFADEMRGFFSDEDMALIRESLISMVRVGDGI